jgi:hypothetical protein
VILAPPDNDPQLKEQRAAAAASAAGFSECDLGYRQNADEARRNQQTENGSDNKSALKV